VGSGVGPVAGGRAHGATAAADGRGARWKCLLSSDDIGGDSGPGRCYVNRAMPDAELKGFVDALATSHRRRSISGRFANTKRPPSETPCRRTWKAGRVGRLHGLRSTAGQQARLKAFSSWAFTNRERRRSPRRLLGFALPLTRAGILTKDYIMTCSLSQRRSADRVETACVARRCAGRRLNHRHAAMSSSTHRHERRAGLLVEDIERKAPYQHRPWGDCEQRTCSAVQLPGSLSADDGRRAAASLRAMGGGAPLSERGERVAGVGSQGGNRRAGRRILEEALRDA